MRPGLDDTLVSLRAPASFAAEQYQALRLQVERLRAVRDVRVLAISSPGLGDGKTVTAINLAAAHAESERVLLIDADLRRPSIGAQLRLTDVSGPGLADALSDDRLELTQSRSSGGRHSFRRDPGRRSIRPGSRTAPIASTRSPPAGSPSSVRSRHRRHSAAAPRHRPGRTGAGARRHCRCRRGQRYPAQAARGVAQPPRFIESPGDCLQ